jgi:hypothetical protein
VARGTILVLVAAIATGCTAGPGPVVELGPADPDAEMRPDLMVADPEAISPGGVVAVTFPEETMRGIHFVLEEHVGESWALRYNLFSDGPGAGWQRSWQPATLEAVVVPDIGVGGPGPDRVPIPEPVTSGDYRICTGNSSDNFCTPIRIGG